VISVSYLTQNCQCKGTSIKSPVTAWLLLSHPSLQTSSTTRWAERNGNSCLHVCTEPSGLLQYNILAGLPKSTTAARAERRGETDWTTRIACPRDYCSSWATLTTSTIPDYLETLSTHAPHPYPSSTLPSHRHSHSNICSQRSRKSSIAQ